MLTLNFDNATENYIKEKSQSEGMSIEDFLKEMLQFYNTAEMAENIELNKIADERLNDGQALIAVSLDDL
ncbi:hypothetical protein DOJK_00457 [Patescibacteria group bacterium]|nr:hypothetical protein DOJK_00457 [Patescibacteria group bacterium]